MVGFLCFLVTISIALFATACASFAKWFGTKNDLDPIRSFNFGLLLGPIGVVAVVVQSSRSHL
jgi:hypothetical protein